MNVVESVPQCMDAITGPLLLEFAGSKPIWERRGRLLGMEGKGKGTERETGKEDERREEH